MLSVQQGGIECTSVGTWHKRCCTPHPLPLLLWDRVFWTYQLLLRSPKRPKGAINGQLKGPSTLWIHCNRPLDVGDSHWSVLSAPHSVGLAVGDCLVMKRQGTHSFGAIAVHVLLSEPAGSHLWRKVSLPCTSVSWQLPSYELLGDGIDRSRWRTVHVSSTYSTSSRSREECGRRLEPCTQCPLSPG